jgi:hypothetical protein
MEYRLPDELSALLAASMIARTKEVSLVILVKRVGYIECTFAERRDE